MSWAPKGAGDVLDYKIDWGERLEGDTITSVTWTIPAGITKDSESNDDTTATIWLSSGTPMEIYQINCRVVTAAGREMGHTVGLRVISR